jgi:hypothetical protein
MRNTGTLVDRMVKGDSKIAAYNNEERTPRRLKMVAEAYDRARKIGRFLTATERFNIDTLGRAGIPGDIGVPPIPDADEFPIIPPEFRKEFSWYEELETRVPIQVGAASCTTEVDLDQISPTTIRPGEIVTLNGTCFGPIPGAVLLRILPDPQPPDLTFPNIVELQIYSWSSTRIEAYLPADFSGFQSAGCAMWVRTVDGYHSNALPVTFAARLSIWIATWGKSIFGGVWGASKSGVLLSGRVLGNANFSIEWTEGHNLEDGHSELQPPNASGQNLAQGWSIGVPAARHASLRILYRLEGPAGMDPPQVPELGGWGLLA